MKKIFFAILVHLICVCRLLAQDTITLALADAIRLGVEHSVDAVVARNEYVSAYWGYHTYKTELLPEVILSGTIPEYSKSYNQFQNGDGTYTYVGNNYNKIDAELSISQNIPWTGGKIMFESSFERLQQNGNKDFTNYRSIPGTVTLEQPLFGFNRIGWLRKIEPVKYKEAQQKLISSREEVANKTIEHYFNLLFGEINMEIAEQNLKNAEKLYIIAEARHKIGQLSETDLLQMKASLLRAESSLINAKTSWDARMFQLRSFIGYPEDIILKPLIPDFVNDDIPVLSYAEVIAKARENNSFTQNIQKRILEASRDVSEAKADRWDISLFASFGMSGQEDSFRKVYDSHNWRGDQVINVGIRVPLLDWGKGKGRVKVAEANREVVQSRIEKEERDFNQDIFIRVQNFNNQPKQLKLAKETDEIALRRYNTSVEAFVLGKIDILNLNDSQSSKDEARRNYIDQMYWLWSYYYQIRSLTLYDFVNNKELTVNYDLK